MGKCEDCIRDSLPKIFCACLVIGIVLNIAAFICIFIPKSGLVEDCKATCNCTPIVTTPDPLAVTGQAVISVFRPNVSQDFYCKDDHILSLGQKEFVSVCLYQDILVDIRTFLNVKGKIYPSVKGIHLTVKQWQALKKIRHLIDSYVRELKKDTFVREITRSG